jgi:lipopolysaccharide assembly LptE-like protein
VLIHSKHTGSAERFLVMRHFLLALFASSLISGCYTFKGFSVDPNLATFKIAKFDNTTFNSPPNIDQTFTESLKRKISRESRLILDERNPDIQFDGSITKYQVSAVSPEPGETTALQRLSITVNIEYSNFSDEEDNWQQSFDFFADYSPNEQLLDRQDELIAVIFDQILEDIFNKAFTNW